MGIPRRGGGVSTAAGASCGDMGGAAVDFHGRDRLECVPPSGWSAFHRPAAAVVTREQCDALEGGMGYQDVASFLGREGEAVGRGPRPGRLSSALYVWRNPDASALVARFEDGHLVATKDVCLP